jgi:hypothetical protein
MNDPVNKKDANSLRRLMLNVLFVLIAGAGILFIADLWLDIFSWAFLGKLLLTAVVGAGILFAWLLIRAHIREEETMSKDKFLN